MSKTTLLVLALLCLAAPNSEAQAPSGSVQFSGPGAELLETTTFVPDEYAGAEGQWSFLQTAASDTLGILVIEDETDPAAARVVSVVDTAGATWFEIGLTSPLEGISIAGDTVTFVAVAVDQDGGDATLVLDGTLTRPTNVSSEMQSIGELKVRFRRP